VDSAQWSNVQPRGTVRVQLIPGLRNESSVVARLNETGANVAADVDHDMVVVRPETQPMVAGMPVYYGSRPVFRGKVLQDDSDRAILVGAIEQSALTAMVNIVGAVFAAFIALLGAMLLMSGDLAGIAALAFAPGTPGPRTSRDGGRSARLWPEVVRRDRTYDEYARATYRPIPVVILEPREATPRDQARGTQN
jgi:hypothetical protein